MGFVDSSLLGLLEFPLMINEGVFVGEGFVMTPSTVRRPELAKGLSYGFGGHPGLAAVVS